MNAVSQLFSLGNSCIRLRRHRRRGVGTDSVLLLQSGRNRQHRGDDLQGWRAILPGPQARRCLCAGVPQGDERASAHAAGGAARLDQGSRRVLEERRQASLRARGVRTPHRGAAGALSPRSRNRSGHLHLRRRSAQRGGRHILPDRSGDDDRGARRQRFADVSFSPREAAPAIRDATKASGSIRAKRL